MNVVREAAANDSAEQWAHLPPAVCVVVLAPDRSGRVLMVQRAKADVGQGYWTPITGRVEREEAIEAAAVRETREEVGLEVEPFKLLWRCPTSIRSHLLHWFLAKPVQLPQQGELPRLDLAEAEIREARWLQPHEIAGELEPTFDDTRRFFTEFAEEIRAASAAR